jgi:tetratricopeptide (TPR) repeat protein
VASSKKKSKTPPSPTEPVVPSHPGASTGEILSWCGFTAILIACMGYVLFHAFLIDRVTVRLCKELDGPNAKPTEVLPVPLLEIAFDGYVWNRHAEKLGENGEWRLRRVDMDNAPEGRECHWNSAFAWYLRGLGEIYRHYTGDTLRNSIFRMSIWANPILLIVALTLFATLSSRRFGPLCGSVLAVGMVTTASFYEGFLPAYPDHHGITAFALMGIIFGIAWAGAGWIQAPSGTAFMIPTSVKQARHGMIFSGISAAAALWISGLSAAVIAVGVAFGAIISVCLCGRKAASEGCFYHPDLWKTWAVATAMGSFGFYILEYFPNHISMRLEVNHPCYALAWLGGGWIIFEITNWIFLSQSRKTPFPWKNFIWPVFAIALLPSLILFGGSQFYMVRDEFQLGIVKNVAEGLPLLTRINMGAITWKVAFGYFPVFILISLGLLAVKKVPFASKGVLIFMIAPVLVVTILQFIQVRWGMLNGPTYIALGALLIPVLWRLLPPAIPWQAAGAIVLTAAAYLFSVDTVKGMLIPFWRQYTSEKNIEVGSGQLLALLHRDMAKAILQNANGKPVVLLSSPNSSCLLATFGGFRTLGTLYWENGQGMKKAANTLNAQSEDEALSLIQKYGITHVSLMTWENFIGPYFQILNPNPVPGKSLENSFGQRALFKKELPRWARPIPYPKNFLSNALQQDVLLLEIVPDQSPDEAEFHLARYQRLAEGNPVAAEIRLKSILDRSPGAAIARMELATLYLDQKRFDDAKNQALEAMKDAPPEARRQNLQNFAQALRQFGATAQADEILKAADKQ